MDVADVEKELSEVKLEEEEVASVEVEAALEETKDVALTLLDIASLELLVELHVADDAEPLDTTIELLDELETATVEDSVELELDVTPLGEIELLRALLVISIDDVISIELDVSRDEVVETIDDSREEDAVLIERLGVVDDG